MKPFEQLSRPGKARRLRKLALNALSQYDLPGADLRLVGMYTNTIFGLRIAEKPAYILRICTPGWRTEIDLRSEIKWLLALKQEPEIEAPIPIPARNGEFWVEARAAGITISCRCVVMSWLPGILLGKRLTEENLYKMGALFARLHAQSVKFVSGLAQNNPIDCIPGDFTQLKMDRVLARGEEDALFSEACMKALPRYSQDVLYQVKSLVGEAFRRLYANPDGLRVIHNDLWHDNIKIFHGRLFPFDFEDTIWGYPVQDIAMALQDLMMDVDAERFKILQNSFRQGYATLEGWPESYPDQVDVFRAGRMIWVANYVARFQQAYLNEHIAGVTGIFERFLSTGKIRKLA